jgi:RNase P subunit RPR2
MKRVVRCLGCGKVARFYGSFNVVLKERTPLLLTGEIKEADLKGQLCRGCATLAGYKVKERGGEKSDGKT